MTITQTDSAFADLQTVETLSPSEIEERAKALRDQLSLDEKISLMHGQLSLWPGLAAMTAPGGYSSQFWVAGEVARLGVPGVRFTDGPRGVILDGDDLSGLHGAGSSLGSSAGRAHRRRHRTRNPRSRGQLFRWRLASTCCATRPGAAPRKPMARILIISAPWAPR